MGPLILLIEDSSDTRMPLANLLRMRGYRVVEAANGDDGLELLRQHPETGAIILDLLMPKSDGWHFREQQLREPDLAHIPVIVFTVATKSDLLQYPLKAHTVLHKPAAVDEIFAAVEACCGPGRSAS